MGDSIPHSPRTAALIAHLTTMMNAQTIELNNQVNELREEFLHQRDTRSNHGRHSQDDEFGDETDRERRRERRHRGHGRHHRNNGDDSRRPRERYEGGKIKFPSFHGKNDADAYLDWELKIDQIFEAHEIEEARRVKLATLEFKDYALLWWDQLVKDRRRCGARQLEDWEELKTILRKRYVPSHYTRELQQKLQRLKQGNKSVEDYYKEFETLRIRANTKEDEEALIARFLNGLSYDIRDVVELQHFMDIEELVHQASKVEQQIKRRSNYNKYSSSKESSSWKHKDSSTWKDKYKREGESSKEATRPKEGKFSNSSKEKNSFTSTTPSHSSKCFKCLGRGHKASNCPNKRVIV